jgi:hypothetical protein
VTEPVRVHDHAVGRLDDDDLEHEDHEPDHGPEPIEDDRG